MTKKTAKDKKIEEITRRAAEWKVESNKLKEQSKKLDEVRQGIIKDFQGLGVHSLEVEGCKITLTKGEVTIYHPEVLERLLPKKIWNRITNRVMSSEKLLEQVSAGNIDKKLLKKATEIKPKAPYITVTIK